eukprot:Gb_12864 [translate_table: standard]
MNLFNLSAVSPFSNALHPQIFNEFNARKPDQKNIFRGLFKNYLFIGVIGITLVLQVLIVEFLEKFASTTKLDWKQWLICIGIGFISWPLAVIVKTIPVPETPFSDYLSRKKSNQTRNRSSACSSKANVEDIEAGHA